MGITQEVGASGYFESGEKKKREGGEEMLATLGGEILPQEKGLKLFSNLPF